MQNEHVVPSSPGLRAKQILHAAQGHTLDRSTRAERATELAAALLALSRFHAQPKDSERSALLGRLMQDPRGQQLTTALTDRLYRSRDPRRITDQVVHLLRLHGLPRYMRWHERAALGAARLVGALPDSPLSATIAQSVLARVSAEARHVLLDAEPRALAAHLGQRHREGVRVNVNQLGEALLGERDAEQRVSKYVALADRPGIDALSVKVSSIASQLHPLSFDSAVELVAERLTRIYTATLERGLDRTLVMLDMEAYAHVELTLAALFRALADPALDQVRAGVVLQAYLPDSLALLERIQAFAQARVARGGLALRVRIVKGANLAAERVESARAGMSLPIFEDKRDVDANFKFLLERSLTKDSTASLSVGIASHNLFDLSYALLLRAEGELYARTELELLEGMAEPVRYALASLGVRVLVYVPICKNDELSTGIAYLVRRLDENTAPENYLRSSFDMREGSAAFEREQARFVASLSRIDQLDHTPRRARDEGFDRAQPRYPLPRVAFRGAPDTDFTRAENRAWIAALLRRERDAKLELLRSSVVGADDISPRDRVVDGVDPSRPRFVPYRVALASAETIERALACAAADASGYARWSLEQRAHLLLSCAAALRGARGSLIATMVLDAGKRVVEADAEVSEAIDFAEYYRASFAQLMRDEHVESVGRGVVLVTPPWNFPLAIAAGGIFAALMAGCRVLFKPALEVALVGARLTALLHAAGVPRDALQVVLCDDDSGSALVRDARVDSVILTGATATARLFQRMRPGLRLLAETGGKNAYIVSAMSDRELAIRDVVQSAFGHSGQKCSAASLLIAEDEVYDDSHFRATLRDAVESLDVGSAWDATSFVTPLIRAPQLHDPNDALARALGTLEPGESWLVEPRISRVNPRLVSPGVKLGVRKGSFTHRTELFGPVLGVMRARSVAHAVELANATGYGLTAGLASLDEREQQYFREHVRAGNLYVNRTITGAIVERQPFGGIGKSGFGPGAKAGGPNYVAQLCRSSVRSRLPRASDSAPIAPALEARLNKFSRVLTDSEAHRLRAYARDYAAAWAAHFAQEHDPSALLGQHNLFLYRACPGVVLRVEADASPVDVAASCIAAELTGTRIEISLDPLASTYQDASVLGFGMRVETADGLLRRRQRGTRLRLLGTRGEVHDRFAAAIGLHIADEPVHPRGRFELLHYLIEQSCSIEHHRYGHISEARR